MLVAAVGAPGALLVCLGIPLGSWLFLRATKARHSNPEFASTFSVMYAECVGLLLS